MAAPIIKTHRAYRDRYVAAGAAPLDLYALMVKPGMPTPATCGISWTTGTGSHWTLTGGSLAASAAGDTADMSSGTYVGTVTMTWAGYETPNDTASAELTVYCPATTVYVDVDTGSDANPGTAASPWAHSPDDPLATGVSAAYTVSGLTLCAHKNGTIARSNWVPTKSANLINASNVGYGTGAKAELTGADLLPASTTPTSGEVGSNPLAASMKKFVLSTAFKKGRYLIDRLADDPLVQWAQWPTVGSDPYKYAFDPFTADGSRGMYQVPVSAFSVAGAATTFTVPSALYSTFDGEFGSDNLSGYLIAFPTSGNFIVWKTITAHNVAGRVLTFDIGSSYNAAAGTVWAMTTGLGSAVQICGHPRSIKAAGQFAWASDAFTNPAPTIFALFADGTAPEIITRKTAVDPSALTDGGVYGMRFVGYFGDTADNQASAVALGRTTGSWKYSALDCDAECLVSTDVCAGAFFRGLNDATSDGCIIQGNTLRYSVRTGLWRLTSTVNQGHHIYGNFADRLSATSCLITNARNYTTIVEHNVVTGGSGPHANIYSYYNQPQLIVRYNHGEGARPLTVEDGPGIISYGNVYIMDDMANGAAIYGGTDHSFTNDAFLRAPGVAGSGAKALSGGGDVVTATFTNCIFDGITGAVNSTYTGCLVSSHATYENAIYNNTGSNTGNVYVPGLWTGELLPAWKAVLGTGTQGQEYLYGIAVIPGLVDLTDQEVSDTVYTGWLGPCVADSVVDWTATDGLMSIATDASGTGATAYAGSGSALAIDGKYVQFEMDLSAGYATDNVMSVDLGNDNVYTWTARTVRENGWTGVDIDGTTPDLWRGPSSALGGANSPYMTLVLVVKPVTYGTTGTFFGHSSGNIAFRADILSTRKFRFSARNSSNVEIMGGFDSPTLPDPAGVAGPKDLIVAVTVDMTQTTAAAATKMALDTGTGLSVVTHTGPTVFNTTGSQSIWWTVANSLFGIGGASIGTGVFSMAYCHNEWVDLTDPDVLGRISALAMAEGVADGTLLTGTQPIGFWVANPTQMNSATTGAWVNLGTGPDLTKQGSTSVVQADGYSSAWPPYTYATEMTVAGPDGVVGETRDYSLSVDGAIGTSRSVTLSDGGAGGTFTPSSLTIDPAAEPEPISFTYEPAADGVVTLTATSSGLTAGTLDITAQPSPATTYTIDAEPSSTTVGVPVVLTLALDGSNALGVSVDFALSGVTGSFSQNPVVIPIDQDTVDVTFTPTSAGSATITPTNEEGLTDPSPLVVTVTGGATGTVTGSRFRLKLRG